MPLPPPPPDLARLALAVREGFGRRGAEVDAFFEVSTHHSVTARPGEPIAVHDSSDHGLLLRCVHARGRASLATSDVGAAGIRHALERAGLPSPTARLALVVPEVGKQRPGPWGERARELTASIVAAGGASVYAAFHVSVRTRYTCVAGELARVSRTVFATFEARAASRGSEGAALFMSVAPDDMALWSAAPLARRLLARARARRPQPTPRGPTEVVLAPGVSGIAFHELVGHPLEADSALAGVSVLATRLGRRVAPSFVTVRDLPRTEGAVDDEGAEEVAVTLVDRGKATGLLHDRLTAGALGVVRTGNARSSGWADEPIPRMRVLSVDAGPHDPRALVGDVREGLYVEDVTEGLSDLSTGRFALPITRARRIVNGKLGEMVTGGRLVGDVLPALRNVRGVGSDARGYGEPVMCVKRVIVPTSAGGPTVLLGRVVVE